MNSMDIYRERLECMKKDNFRLTLPLIPCLGVYKVRKVRNACCIYKCIRSLTGRNATSGTHTIDSVYSGTHTIDSVYSGTHTIDSVYSGKHTIDSVYSGKQNKPKEHYKTRRKELCLFHKLKFHDNFFCGISHDPGKA